MMNLLWQLDDAAHWHHISAATITQWNHTQSAQHWDFRSFIHSHDLFSALDAILNTTSNAHPLPAIILMDYYLINERGDHVTRALCDYFAHTDHPVPTIIGHSSVATCSQHICAAGAHLALTKCETDNGINRHLRDYLASLPSHNPQRHIQS